MEEQAVRARDLALAYDGRVVLRVDTLDLPRAAVVALVGPNGSGKSTLLSAIGGLLAPLTGQLDVLGVPARQARARVAFVLQQTAGGRLLPITAAEVVRMARFATRGAWRPLRARDRAVVAEAMARLEVTAFADTPLRDLSGGQRQRVLVAQGLAQEGELLLLDEPLTGLDLASQRRILAVVAEERDAGRTVVVATHDLAEAARADVAVLLSGRVVACGPPAVALSDDALRAAYGGRLVEVAEGHRHTVDDDHHEHEPVQPPGRASG